MIIKSKQAFAISIKILAISCLFSCKDSNQPAQLLTETAQQNLMAVDSKNDDQAKLKERADAGDANAQRELGTRLLASEKAEDKTDGLNLIKKAATQGNTEAQNQLGNLFFASLTVSQNKEEAFKWYLKAAEQGFTSAQNMIYYMLSAGDGTEIDKEKAFFWAEKSALSGDAAGQFNLGKSYLNGDGVKKNPQKGAEWVLKAAAQGMPYAQGEAASLYREGDVLTHDPQKALYWASCSADNNSGKGFYELARLYESGVGVPRNIPKSKKLYQNALEKGYNEAHGRLASVFLKLKNYGKAFEYAKQGHELNDCYSTALLGYCYFWGYGVERDLKKAKQLYLESAAKNESTAQFRMGVIFFTGQGEGQNDETAFKWFTQAAEQNHSEALNALGVYYLNGYKPVKKNATKAADYFRRPAAKDSDRAKLNLGKMYLEESGVKKDTLKAVDLFNEIAKEGDSHALNQLGYCYLSGEGVVKNPAEALVCFYLSNANGGTGNEYIIPSVEKGLSPQSILLCQQKAEQIFLKQKYEKEKEVEEGNSKPSQHNEGQARKLPQPAGSGVLISKDGLFVTAYHVIESAKGIAVRTSKGAFNVKILAVDKLNDLALLKVKDPIGEMPAAPLAPSAKMKLGQTVFTLGFPNSDLQGFNVKMTKGEISSTTGIQDDPRQFQISVPLQPGNSGGALFDDQGNIIGIVVAKLSETVAKKYTGNTPENVNYAVKSSYIYPLTEQVSSNINPKITDGPVPKLEEVVERVKDACVLVLVEE